MGIFIHLSISQSVTKEEWASVYKETLQLVDAFPLAERLKVPIRGIKTMCLIPTKERDEVSSWDNEKVRTGWFADGDYESLHIAEDYFLPRDLVTDESYDADAPDAMFSILPSYLDYSWDDPRFRRCYDLWDSKTQAEPYHMYLLAIACLIESRLGQKACVYGDITRGQCRKAVEIANKHLEKKIDLPDRCDPERLLKRIKTFPLSEAEILKVYIDFYLGTTDANFGNEARKQFSESAFDEYWKERLDDYQVTTRGFASALHDYLLWGFDLEKLARYVTFTDKDGTDHYDDFVKSIMETNLHVKEKDVRDHLLIDKEDERPYGINTLFAQLAYGGAANRKVDRYIPLESIRSALISSIGDKCDVNRLIDKYLEEDEEYQKLDHSDFASLSEKDLEKAIAHDPSAVFTQTMDKRINVIEEIYEEYDISDFEDLQYYETGDSIDPDIAEQVGSSFAFYRSLLKEKNYTDLMDSSPRERCEWLVFQNQGLLLRDKDWDKIFGDIMENPDSFARYYPCVRMKLTSNNMIYVLRAIILNDAFYQYAFSLEKEYSKKKKED